MSIKQILKVWQHKLSHNEQSIALAYADHANEDGTGMWPSTARISHKTGYSKRSVQRIRGTLVEQGVLVEVRSATSRRPTEYRFDWSAAEPKPPFEERGNRQSKGGRQNNTPPSDGESRGDTGDTPRGDSGDTPRVTQVTPEPSYNRQEEPSEVSSLRSDTGDPASPPAPARAEGVLAGGTGSSKEASGDSLPQEPSEVDLRPGEQAAMFGGAPEPPEPDYDENPMKHPAVGIYRSVLKLTPGEAQRRLIADEIGASDGAALSAWKTQCKRTAVRGWRKTNVPGILTRTHEQLIRENHDGLELESPEAFGRDDSEESEAPVRPGNDRGGIGEEMRRAIRTGSAEGKRAGELSDAEYFVRCGYSPEEIEQRSVEEGDSGRELKRLGSARR